MYRIMPPESEYALQRQIYRRENKRIETTSQTHLALQLLHVCLPLTGFTTLTRHLLEVPLCTCVKMEQETNLAIFGGLGGLKLVARQRNSLS